MTTCSSTGIGWNSGCFSSSVMRWPRVIACCVALSRSLPNWAKAASSRNCASWMRRPPEIFFMAPIWAEPPTRLTEMPALTPGRWPALNSDDSRKIWPSVIEMTLVGMYADTSPSCVSTTGSAVIEPPPFSLDSLAARSSRRLCRLNTSPGNASRPGGRRSSSRTWR